MLVVVVVVVNISKELSYSTNTGRSVLSRTCFIASKISLNKKVKFRKTSAILCFYYSMTLKKENTKTSPVYKSCSDY